MVQLALCLCLKHYPAPLENPTTCFYFLSRWCTCSYQLHPLSLPPSLPPTPPPPTTPLAPGLTTVPRAHCAALHSPSLSAAPVRLTDSQNQLVWPSFLFPAFSLCVCCCCCCCCCLVSTYADGRRRHIPPSPLSEGRFQFAFTFLLAGTIGFRAVPVNSPPSPARVEQQQLGNIWPPQSARLPVPAPARLGSLLWKLVQSQSSFVSEGKKRGFWRRKRGRRWTFLSVSAASNTGVRLKEAQEREREGGLRRGKSS